MKPQGYMNTLLGKLHHGNLKSIWPPRVIISMIGKQNNHIDESNMEIHALHDVYNFSKENFLI